MQFLLENKFKGYSIPIVKFQNVLREVMLFYQNGFHRYM